MWACVRPTHNAWHPTSVSAWHSVSPRLAVSYKVGHIYARVPGWHATPAAPTPAATNPSLSLGRSNGSHAAGGPIMQHPRRPRSSTQHLPVNMHSSRHPEALQASCKQDTQGIPPHLRPSLAPEGFHITGSITDLRIIEKLHAPASTSRSRSIPGMAVGSASGADTGRGPGWPMPRSANLATAAWLPTSLAAASSRSTSGFSPAGGIFVAFCRQSPLLNQSRSYALQPLAAASSCPPQSLSIKGLGREELCFLLCLATEPRIVVCTAEVQKEE